jgi:hypothetical protein
MQSAGADSAAAGIEHKHLLDILKNGGLASVRRRSEYRGGARGSLLSNRKFNSARAGSVISSYRTLADRLGSFFCRPTAGNLAYAESAKVASADSTQENAENTGFPFLTETEQQVR